MVTLQYFVHRLKKKEASFTLRIKSCQYPLISNIFAIPDKVKADRNESNYCSKKKKKKKLFGYNFEITTIIASATIATGSGFFKDLTTDK